LRRCVGCVTNKSHRESDFFAAAPAFFGDNDNLDHRTRLAAYASAIDRVGRSYPDDREASLFYALSLLATADPLDATYARQRQAGEVLERIFKELPDHPAAAHYIIHAYDCGPLAERALEAAERYAKAAYVVPHAIHMPSHTYVLLGRWQDNIESNLAGEKAERERGIPEDRLHDIDYLVYGYLQIGDDAKAKEFRDLGLAVEQALVAAKRDVGLRARSFTIAAIEARYALERSSWSEAAALQRPNRWASSRRCPTSRGQRAARSGHPATAKADIDRLTELQADLVKPSSYWARVVDASSDHEAWTDAEGTAPTRCRSCKLQQISRNRSHSRLCLRGGRGRRMIAWRASPEDRQASRGAGIVRGIAQAGEAPRAQLPRRGKISKPRR
jgi:hypothetical protein